MKDAPGVAQFRCHPKFLRDMQAYGWTPLVERVSRRKVSGTAFRKKRIVIALHYLRAGILVTELIKYNVPNEET